MSRILCDFKESSLSQPLIKMLELLEQKKRDLDQLRPLSGEQTANLKKVYDLDLTYHSNAIEGSTLSFAETRLILEEGLTIGGKKLNEHLEAINHKEAIDFIEELAQQKVQGFSERDLLDLHALVLRAIDKDNAGRYRTIPVGTRTAEGEIREFCDPLQVQSKIEEFFNWLLTLQSQNPLQVAADAHYYLVTIHPFADGNGRVARLLMNLLLIQAGYPPAVIRLERRLDYIQSLNDTQIQEENSPASRHSFYNVVFQAVESSLDLTLNTLKTGMKFL